MPFGAQAVKLCVLCVLGESSSWKRESRDPHRRVVDHLRTTDVYHPQRTYMFVKFNVFFLIFFGTIFCCSSGLEYITAPKSTSFVFFASN